LVVGHAKNQFGTETEGLMARWWKEPYTEAKALAAGVHDWE
jgi:hypothetical protein